MPGVGISILNRYKKTIVSALGFLLQEDSNFILQEDGYKIIIET